MDSSDQAWVERMGPQAFDDWRMSQRLTWVSYLGGLGFLVLFAIGVSAHLSALAVVGIVAFFALAVPVRIVAVYWTLRTSREIRQKYALPKETMRGLTTKTLRDAELLDGWLKRSQASSS